ncbi:DUF1127 domain-containing protein [Rhizobium sp. BK060]|nr:DUF1127 domain-containing protein [Rhizobium sp. BK060]MBB3395998.1 uncharacterized protein YjiS (DUF1127 family) [Rhizobium sp. BK060]
MSIRKKIYDFAARERAIRQLRALDDRSLSDIGLSRGEIRSAMKNGKI